MGRIDVSSALFRRLGRHFLAVLTAAAVLAGAGPSGADPAADALARMNELSREAERLTEQLYAAEIDEVRWTAVDEPLPDDVAPLLRWLVDRET